MGPQTFAIVVGNLFIAFVAATLVMVLRNNRPATRAAFLDVAMLCLAVAPALRLANCGVKFSLPVGSLQSHGAPITLGATLVAIYVAGTFIGALGLAFGLVRLLALTGDADIVEHEHWQRANENLSARQTALLKSGWAVSSPLSWGFRPGTILLDPQTLDRRCDARAVLAHEHAHLRRGDWPLMMIGRIVVILNWWNPLVWFLARSRARAAEEAADERALQFVDRVSYASALLAAARASGPALGVPMSRGALRQRISLILEPRRRSPNGEATDPMCFVVLIASLSIQAAVRYSSADTSIMSRESINPVTVEVPMPVPVPVPVPVPMADR